MTNKEKIIQTLKEALPTLKNLKDNFYIIGSTALLLSDIKIDNISDIDILTTENDAEFLRTEWENRIIKNHVLIDSELFSSKFSRNRFSVLDIEILGGLKINIKGEWTKLEIFEYITVTIDNFDIKIPTLKEQKRILSLFGRKKDIDKLNKIEENKQN